MQFLKGLIRDSAPIAQPEGSYRDLRNGVVHEELGRLENEKGTTLSTSLPEDCTVVGHIVLSDNRIVLFLAFDSGSEIGVFDRGSYTPIINSPVLNLQSDTPVEGEYRINSTQETLIYWTDGINPPKYLNLQAAQEEGFVPTESNLRLFPQVSKLPEFNLKGIKDYGGSLKTGSYNLAFAYVDSEGTATNYLNVTRPIYVNDDATNDDADGAPAGTPTSKAINFELRNLDTDFERIRIAVIKGSNVKILDDLPLPNDGVLNQSYNGNESYTDGSLDEVIVNKASYESVKTMKQQGGILYMGNVDKTDTINYQKYANNIEVECVSRDLDTISNSKISDPANLFKDPDVAFQFRTYQRDEIYAFYISFLMQDGSESPAFHIPGRSPQGSGDSDGYATGSITVTSPARSITPAKATGGFTIDSFAESVVGYFEGKSELAGTFDTQGNIDIVLYDAADTEVARVNVTYATPPTGSINGSRDNINDFLRDIINTLNGNESFNNNWEAEDNGTANEIRLMSTKQSEVADLSGYTLVGENDTTGNVSVNSLSVTTENTEERSLPDQTILFRYMQIEDFQATITGLQTGMALSDVTQAYTDGLNNTTAFSDHLTATNTDNRIDIESNVADGKVNGDISVNYGSSFTNLGMSISNSNDLTGGRSNDAYFNQPLDNLGEGSLPYVDFVSDGSAVIELDLEIYPDETRSSIADKVEQKFLSETNSFDVVSRSTSSDGSEVIAIRSTRQTNIYNDGHFKIVPEDSGVSTSYTTISGGGLTGTGTETTQIKKGHPLYDNNRDDEDQPLSFQFTGAPDVDNNMAYWQNADELYPDTDNFDIWAVDDQGEGYNTENTLRNRNVRHHHFPENKYEPFYQNNKIRVLGVKFKNIQIPDNIKEKVAGYKFHYAKRSDSDSKIIDQGSSIFAWKNFDGERGLAPYSWSTRYGNIDNSDYIPFGFPMGIDDLNETPKNWNNLVERDSLYFHPFRAMRKRLNLASAVYIKGIAEKVIEDSTTVSQISVDNINDFNSIFPIRNGGSAISYINHHTERTGTKSSGLREDTNNLYGESKILLEIEEDLRLENYIFNICSLPSNLYNSFSSQELVSIGDVFTDLDSNETSVMYGGDTFISKYSFRATHGASPYDRDYNVELGLGLKPNEGAAKNVEYISKRYPEYGHIAPDDSVYDDLEELEERYPPFPMGYIHTEVVESKDNIGLRHEGETVSERYYPKSEERDYTAVPNINDFPELPEDLPNDEKLKEGINWWQSFFAESDNFYGYNEEYSNENTLKPAFPRDQYKEDTTSYPTRVIRSQEGKFRTFLENDFMDLPRNRGELVHLDVMQNTLIPHLERALVRTRGREELTTGDFRAYLGVGDIFSVKPDEIVTTDSGYGGLQHPKTCIVTRFGYFFVDAQARKVFLMQQGLDEISNYGMKEWFSEHLEMSPNEDLIATFDDEHNRFILTKLSDTDSWTISYDPARKRWISFHDYIPDYYLSNLNHFYGITSNSVYRHGNGQRGNYYGISYPFSIEFVDNREPQLAKRVASLLFYTIAEEEDGTHIPDETFSSFQITNNSQDTGEEEIIPFPEGKARRTRKEWAINQFRDVSNVPSNGNLPDWAYKNRLVDKYHIVKLHYHNSEGNVLGLISARLNSRIAKR